MPVSKTLVEDADRLLEIVHDLRTPLTVVLGFAELVLETEADPERRARLEALQQAARTMQALSGELAQTVTDDGMP